MWSRLSVVVVLTAVAVALAIAPAASGQGVDELGLEMYTLKGPADKISEAAGGTELAGVRQTQSGLRAEAVLTRGQSAKLAASGVQVELTRNRKGQTVTQQAAAQAAGGYNVYRSWDEPGGIRDELYNVARHEGAIGGKITGAGGGGYMLLYCQFDKKRAVRDKMREMGVWMTEVSLEPLGLQTWRVNGKVGS